MDKYEAVKERVGSGHFGVVKLMRHRVSNELVAMKFIPRSTLFMSGDEYVVREIINHRSLHHPNIISFKEVVLTPTHLVIVMEYAAGGELFDLITGRELSRFTEPQARYFFQQLISGVSYCHAKQICHRDLKLDNTLLDGSKAPRLKICDFGYSKSSILHSRPNSKVGSPQYIAPEVMSAKEYDGKAADVWSCGVILYVMLIGAYPFDDSDKNLRKIFQNIQCAKYKIPDFVSISQECRDLLSRMLVGNPSKRISMAEIKSHPWFLTNLPKELSESAQEALCQKENGGSCYLQSVDEIMKIVAEAKKPPPSSSPVDAAEEEEEEEEEEEDSEYEKIVREVHAAASGKFQRSQFCNNQRCVYIR